MTNAAIRAPVMKSACEAIVWWEIRRILFNALVLVAGVLTGFIVLAFGDDPEPFAWLSAAVLYGIFANLAYTLGWISELLWSQGDTTLTKPARRTVFWIGTGFSIALTLLPAALIPVIWIFAR